MAKTKTRAAAAAPKALTGAQKLERLKQLLQAVKNKHSDLPRGHAADLLEDLKAGRISIS